MFGKCEVCFRQGHCSITECQDQQKNQLSVIDSIVDHLPLRPQNSQAQVVSQVSGEIKLDIQDINRGISVSLNDYLKDAVSVGSTAPIINQVNNLMNNYVLNSNPGDFLHPYSILNTNHNSATVSPTERSNPNGNELLPGVERIAKIAEQIEDDVSKIHMVQSDEKGNHKANRKANEALHKEVDTLKRVDKLVDQVEESFEVAQHKIEELLHNPKITDPNTKAALADSLNQIKFNTAELDNIHKSAVKAIHPSS